MRLLEELTWPELDTLDRDHAVVLIPISPLEEHGPHLPIGTDLIIARRLAEQVARLIEERRPGVTAVLAPAVPIGAGTIPMRGSVNISVDLVYDVARQMGAALARDGFRTIVYTSGHMSLWHLIALENAARWVSRRFRVQAIAPSAALARTYILRGEIEPRLAARLTPDERSALMSAAHSGTLETSIMLALRPDLVHASFAGLPPRPRASFLGWRGRRPAAWQGYFGDPSRARADWGQVSADTLADAGAVLVLDVLDRGEAGARAGRLVPRVPFWLAARRLRRASLAASIGAALALISVRIISSKGRQHHVPVFVRFFASLIRGSNKESLIKE